MQGVYSEWHYLVNECYALKNKTSTDYDAFVITSTVETGDGYNFLEFLLGGVRCVKGG